MSGFIVTEAHVQRAFNILQSNDHAAARAAYDFSEKQLKVILAKAEAQSNAKTISERQNEALRSDEYERALSAWKLVSEAYFTARDKREASIAIIDAWRTQSADQRAMGRVG